MSRFLPNLMYPFIFLPLITKNHTVVPKNGNVDFSTYGQGFSFICLVLRKEGGIFALSGIVIINTDTLE